MLYEMRIFPLTITFSKPKILTYGMTWNFRTFYKNEGIYYFGIRISGTQEAFRRLEHLTLALFRTPRTYGLRDKPVGLTQDCHLDVSAKGLFLTFGLANHVTSEPYCPHL